MEYKCESPVVLIIFNRPNITQKTFDIIKKVKPANFIIISDGPRKEVYNEFKLVDQCRDIVSKVDWECDLVKIFSDKNMGCMSRIVTGLDEVFKHFDKAIIIEDDCVPTITFFKFMDWGLHKFEYNNNVGMISGSNLCSNEFNIVHKNGFSRFINIWGWACWRRTWLEHNTMLSIHEVNRNLYSFLKSYNFKYWQFLYWKELLKFTIYKGSTWDFQLQYTFFKKKLLAVYPKYNLVNNNGFDSTSTHTNITTPQYVLRNFAIERDEMLYLETDNSYKNSDERDNYLASTIWNYNIFSMFKLMLKNIIRFTF
jgi:hypothetical protein